MQIKKISLKSVFLQIIIITSYSLYSCVSSKPEEPRYYSGNPLLPGDFADPCLLVHQDTFYLYATAWDSKDAIVWYSPDFQNWKMKKLNWPTADVGLPIWAPCVVQGKDGRFYFYSSTSHCIYAGVADHPAGPFRNLLPNEEPLVRNRQYWDHMHTIDADCFVDDDGQAYLYWGSGFDFKNGICAVARLNDDMCSFKENPIEITPANYFEAPHMAKRDSIYYLMYSDGICIEDSYKIRYATSKSPMGPFVEGENSPILTNTPDSLSWSSGHHYTIRLGDEDYIVYHKQAIPVYTPFWGPIRQVAMDKLVFETSAARIENVVPTREGICIDNLSKDLRVKKRLIPQTVTASQSVNDRYAPSNAFDEHNGTLWGAPTAAAQWILADFGNTVAISSVEPVFDIVDGDYEYRIEYSTNGEEWSLYDAANNAAHDEWPHEHRKAIEARYLRLNIAGQTKEPNRVGLWELRVF